MVKDLHIEEKDLENDEDMTDNEVDEPVPLVKEKKPRSAKQIEAFKPRTDNALEILINDCSFFYEAYNASCELNEKSKD